MIIPITITGLSISKTEDEWRAVLVDPSAFQDELRAALGEQRAATDDRSGNIALGKRAYRMNGGDIARAAKKQNKKIAKRFLAPGGAVSCGVCNRTFQK